jgi:peptidoglycan/LPS O-acetylase OafA/YrhL
VLVDRIPALTGLRGVAALWVLIFHAWALAGPASSGLPAPATVLFGAGWLGVDVFFVLSGFLLARGLHGAGDRVDWRDYAVMRAARILPAYYAQLVLLTTPVAAMLLPGAVVWSPEDGADVLAHAALWLNAWPWVPPHLGPWWSLSVEAGFYLALPALWLLGASGRRMLVLTLGAVAVSVVWRAALQDSVPELQHRIGLAEHLPGRGVQFVIGMALAWWLRQAKPIALPLGTASALFALAVLVALPQLGGERAYAGVVDGRVWTWFWPLLTALPVAALLAALVVWPASGVARLLASAPFRMLGAISFSLYLWHYPVQWALRGALGGYVPPSWGFSSFVAAGSVLSIAVATLSWWAVEQPVLHAARRWRSRRRGRLPAP